MKNKRIFGLISFVKLKKKNCLKILTSKHLVIVTSFGKHVFFPQGIKSQNKFMLYENDEIISDETIADNKQLLP